MQDDSTFLCYSSDLVVDMEGPPDQRLKVVCGALSNAYDQGQLDVENASLEGLNAVSAQLEGVFFLVKSAHQMAAIALAVLGGSHEVSGNYYRLFSPVGIDYKVKKGSNVDDLMAGAKRYLVSALEMLALVYREYKSDHDLSVTGFIKIANFALLIAIDGRTNILEGVK